ncbi:DUF4388 domain-containing protein, partial [bacterium]
ASQGKTGVLEITTEEGRASVRFVRGQLFDAVPPTKDPNTAIGIMLVRAELITQKQLDYALDLQNRNLRRLGDTLIRMGAIRTGEFQAMLALQRRELAFNLMRLKRGQYKFNACDIEYEEGVDTLLSIDALLMEGSRQIDEWPAIMRKIPSDKLVFRKIEGKFPGPKFEPEDQAVFRVIDGARTVKQVVDVARQGEFNGWCALLNLYDGGLIEVVRETKPVVEKVEKKPTKPMGATIADIALSAIAAAIALILLGSAIIKGGLLSPAIFTMPVESVKEFRSLEARNLQWGSRTPENWPDAAPKTGK